MRLAMVNKTVAIYVFFDDVLNSMNYKCMEHTLFTKEGARFRYFELLSMTKVLQLLTRLLATG